MAEQESASPSTAVEGRPDIISVTGETFQAFVDEQLNTPEQQAAQELEQIQETQAQTDAQAAATDDPAEEFVGDQPPAQKLSKKEKLNARFKELTDAKKEAEAKAAAKEAEAKAAREEREAAARERDELRAKYEPPKSDELGAKPELSQFGSTEDYEKALTDWTTDKVRIEAKAKAETERAEREADEIKTNWSKNLKATKEKYADYADVLAAAEDKISFSKEAQEEIIKSDLGAEMLYYYAKPENHAEATKLGEMTIRGMIKELGRLEVKLGDKPQSATTAKVAEISKAPPPITPIRNGSGIMTHLKGSDDVPKGMSYDQWKKMYEAGKIH